jgi:hypothetical protein
MHSTEDTSSTALEAIDVPPQVAHPRRSGRRLFTLALICTSFITVVLIVVSSNVGEFSGYKIIPFPPLLCPVFPEMNAYSIGGRTIYLAFQDSSACGDLARLPRNQHNQDYVFLVGDVAIDNGKTTRGLVVRCEYSQQSNIIDLNNMPILGRGTYGVSGQTNDTRWGMCKIDTSTTINTPATVILHLTSQSNHTRAYTIPLLPVNSASFFIKETLSDTIWVMSPSQLMPGSDSTGSCYCIER